MVLPAHKATIGSVAYGSSEAAFRSSIRRAIQVERWANRQPTKVLAWRSRSVRTKAQLRYSNNMKPREEMPSSAASGSVMPCILSFCGLCKARLRNDNITNVAAVKSQAMRAVWFQKEALHFSWEQETHTCGNVLLPWFLACIIKAIPMCMHEPVTEIC
eukprot:707325-Pleurochrysis_carterae.AAC.2